MPRVLLLPIPAEHSWGSGTTPRVTPAWPSGQQAPLSHGAVTGPSRSSLLGSLNAKQRKEADGTRDLGGEKAAGRTHEKKKRKETEGREGEREGEKEGEEGVGEASSSDG